MIPWYGWAYLVLLALVGLSGFALTLRAGQSTPLALVRVAAMGVLMWGVVLYFRDAGAGPGVAVALIAAVLVLAHKSTTDLRDARRMQLKPAAQAGTAINGLLVLPAVALGALAVWSGHGG